MPRISLCVIARDEEAWIGDCLDSARNAVDEMVVVDTGSNDRTAEIARARGARVVEHPWQDDFARARNAALAAATGEWILVLDADERLVDAEAVRTAVASGALDCGLLPLHSAGSVEDPWADVVSGKRRRGEPVALPRLFRRTPDLHWVGVIHEHVEAWLHAPGRRVGLVPAPLVHYGGIAEVRQTRAKAERNLRLLERRVAADPTDAAGRVYLATELREAGQAARAREEVDAAWKLLLGEADRARTSLVSAATQRALLQLVAQDPAGALETVNTAIDQRRTPHVHPNLYYLFGLACENLAVRADHARRRPLLEAAVGAYVEANKAQGLVFPEPCLAGVSSWATAIRLGTVLLQLELPDLALDAFTRVLERRPDHAEAILGRAEALIDLGRPGEALPLLEPLLGQGGADAYLLAAAAARALGAHREHQELLGRARATVRHTLQGLHRLKRLNEMLAVA